MSRDDGEAAVTAARMQRRQVFRQAALGAIAVSAFGGGSTVFGRAAAAATDPSLVTDVNILNFALNLEYLEAEFYLRGATGKGLTDADTAGTGKRGPVWGGSKVTFSSALNMQYAQEVANDELNHVRFLRAALKDKAVARPTIDLKNSFTYAARAAGVIGPNDVFDAFANEANFLLAAFIFEDVGVSAYNGAATFIKNKDYLQAAAGILATEAYHAGSIRTMLLTYGLSGPANKISALRGAASKAADNNTGMADDEGVTVNGVANVVSADANSIAFARTFDEVLNIVYLGGASGYYGFFPDMLNGKIK